MLNFLFEAQIVSFKNGETAEEFMTDVDNDIYEISAIDEYQAIEKFKNTYNVSKEWGGSWISSFNLLGTVDALEPTFDLPY